MPTIHLDRNMVPAELRGSYTGNSFKAVVTETVTIPAGAGMWQDGSRDTWFLVNLTTGARMSADDHAAFRTGGQEKTAKLEPDVAVVCHSIFCGKDTGLTFYVHPENARKLLPAPVELSDLDKLVLVATRNLKASYAGRDRYQMAEGEHHCRKVLGNTLYPSRPQWEATKQSLIGRGLLNKAGAITTAGKNAIQSIR